MSRIKIAFMVLLGLAITTTACKKEEVDTIKPLIGITMTTPGDLFGQYSHGGTIECLVEANDETSLNAVEITITREHDGVVVFEEIDQDLKKAFTSSVLYALDNDGYETDYTVRAVATDKGNNSAESSLTFHSNP